MIRKFRLPQDGGFRRGLKDRHVQLIALGGIIGSGFFLGTGELVKMVGPAVFLAYIFGGIIIYLTMLCLGELAVAIPISGSFVAYAADFISPSVACGIGWSYWLNWVVYIPAECIAAGIILEMFTGINGFFLAIMFGFIITAINLIKVEAFGEIEFWLALIKIIALLGFVVLSVFIFFGVIHGHQPSKIIGLTYLTHQGGLLPNGAMAFLSAMVLMLVNYQGSEIIGLAAGESKDPAKMIPHAIRNVTFRIIGLYILPVFCLVMIFPWSKASIENSVFAEVLNFYGLKWLGAFVSFVTLTAALSCANSGFFGAVRALNALARDGMAPEFLAKFNHLGAPKNAAMATIVTIWIMLIPGYFFGKSDLYIALLLISGFSGTICWISLCYSQIKFRRKLKANGYDYRNLSYVTPFAPWTGIIAILLMIAALFMQFFSEDKTFRLGVIPGVLSFIIPALLYRLFNVEKKRKEVMEREHRIRFNDIFPKKPVENEHKQHAEPD